MILLPPVVLNRCHFIFLVKVRYRSRNTAVAALILLALGGIACQAQPLSNKEATIPPQCYTKTLGKYNPCYVCHQNRRNQDARNSLNDGYLQGVYAFSDWGKKNRWLNMLVGRENNNKNPKPDLAMTIKGGSPEKNNHSGVRSFALETYVQQDNTTGLYEHRDVNRPNKDAYTLDIKNLADPEKAFDVLGLATDGSAWVAFNYKPFPSTFWPTNGSFGDAMIRLPKAFRENKRGEFSSAIYFINLSLLEMNIQARSAISIPETDERKLGWDLDGNNILTKTALLQQRDYYVGNANTIRTEPLQYPKGTEFLHTVRYLQVEKDKVIPSRRVKEVRYMRKYKTLNDSAVRFMYNEERREKALERLPKYSWAKPVEKSGLNNKMGWYIQGWIEDKQGALRLANYEENFYCMGCHTTIGATIDHTFSFPRKLSGRQGWGYIDLDDMPDAPSRGELSGEFLTYFTRVGGGDEFRQNTEMLERWFDENGKPKIAIIKESDVATLILPSPERAHQLNAAYFDRVQKQNFILGREITLGDVKHIHAEINPESAPTLPPEKQFRYDIRLRWPDDISEKDSTL